MSTAHINAHCPPPAGTGYRFAIAKGQTHPATQAKAKTADAFRLTVMEVAWKQGHAAVRLAYDDGHEFGVSVEHWNAVWAPAAEGGER